MFGIRTPPKLIKNFNKIIYNKMSEQQEIISQAEASTSTTSNTNENISTELQHINIYNRKLQSPIPVPVLSQHYKTRVSEAKAYLVKGSILIRNSRNLRKDIKTGVIESLEKLYLLVKEAEEGKPYENIIKENIITSQESILDHFNITNVTKNIIEKDNIIEGEIVQLLKENKKEINKIQTTLEELKEQQQKTNQIEKIKGETVSNCLSFCHIVEENNKIIKENNRKINDLKVEIQENKKYQENRSYANVVAGQTRKQPSFKPALHSVIISSKIETETGDEVLNQIKEVIKATENDIKIDRIRKAKDAKVIISCGSKEERNKIKEKLHVAKDKLKVEEIKNKNPLINMKYVKGTITDEEILKSLRNLNKEIFTENEKEKNKIEIAYRKKTYNQLINHIVIRVSPQIWKSMLEKGYVHLDYQRVKVEDQSPLIQCTNCLEYGHGRKYCKHDKQEKCSHCGEQHFKTQCEKWITGQPPTCSNCVHAKMVDTNHNAFSDECRIKKKWEDLARSSINYC